MAEEQIDIELPRVVASAWREIQSNYGLGDLGGPSSETVLGREARKWYATAEAGGDLASVDIYVLESGSGIPGVQVVEGIGGHARYFRSGLLALGSSPENDRRRSALDMYSDELFPEEVEALRPGVPVRVVVETMEGGEEVKVRVRRYKNNQEDIERLVDSISAALDKVGVLK